MSKPTVLVVAAVVLLTTISGVAGAVTVTTDADQGGAGDVATTGSVAQSTVDVSDLDSGETYWSGARLQFDASPILDEAGESGDARTFELWRVADDGRLSQRVRTFTVAEDGTHQLETGSLTGRYAIRYGDRIVYVHDGVGYLEAPPDGSRVTVDASAFALERQTLALSWSDPTVYPGQRVTLTMTSNRDDYAVAVSGTNLTYQNLTDAFPRTAYAENHDARADEDVLLLSAGATTNVRLDTMVLEPGQGSLEFDVIDTTTAETTEITVQEPAEDRRFLSLDRRENVGDVIEANISCTGCFLVVGGPGQGFLDVVELTDANGDGHVVLNVNTRYVGMNTGAPGYPNDVDAYASPDDSVRRYTPSTTLETLSESLVYSHTKLSDLRAQQGLDPTGRTRPIETAEIRLTVSGSDFVIDRSGYGDREPLGSQVVVRDEADVRTVSLEPRRPAEAESMAAPGAARLPSDVEDLRSTVGPRDSVALGDHLVFRFDVPGLFGYLAAEDADAATFVSNRDEGIDLTLESLDDGNGEASTSYQLDRTALALYTDPSTDSLYVAIQTGGTSSTNLQDGRYRATLTLAGVEGRYDEYSTVNAHRGNPYLDPGETETVSSTARLSPATATIESPEEGSSPRLNADARLVVRGKTSIARGSTLRIEVASTDYAWDTTETATVDESGRWTTALPLGDAPGEEFTVKVSEGGSRLAEETYTVRPPAPNASDDGDTSDGSQSDASGSGGPLGGGEDGGLLSSLPGLSGLAVPVGGGFGALVAIWAGWRLVIRRLLL